MRNDMLRFIDKMTYRLMNNSGFFLVSIGLLLIFFFKTPSLIHWLLIFTLLSLGVGIIMLDYLRGIKKYSISDIYLVKEEINSLKEDLSKTVVNNIELSSEERAQVIGTLQSKLAEIEVKSYLNSIKEELLKELNVASEIEAIDKQFKKAIDRLEKELTSLGLRGNLNLVLGIIITAVGLGILSIVIFNHQASSTSVPEPVLSYYIPRLSLVLSVEVFAYFFLKLYKQILGEIKYFQNEITNIELKYLSLRASLQEGNAAIKKDICKLLASTERNFILKKGETTVDLEKEKLGQKPIETIIQAIGKIKNLSIGDKKS